MVKLFWVQLINTLSVNGHLWWWDPCCIQKRFFLSYLENIYVTFALVLQPDSQNVQPFLGTHMFPSALGSRDWDLLANTKGFYFGPHLPPSWGTQRALILLCQPLSTPAHYTTSWEISGVYFSIKKGQYLCGMWNNNIALWEYYTGPEKGAGLFIRNKSFAALHTRE